jgi:hypothetical protein
VVGSERFQRARFGIFAESGLRMTLLCLILPAVYEVELSKSEKESICHPATILIYARLQHKVVPERFAKTAISHMKLQIIPCLAIVALSVPLSGPAATPKASVSPAESISAGDTAAEGKMHAIPFRGVIATFDDKARIFTIAGRGNARSLKVTDTTVITKGGNPATVKDIVANEEVRGSYYKMNDGTLEAKTVKLGPLTEAEKADKEARKEKREAKKASATP